MIKKIFAKENEPEPVKLTLHKISRTLEINFVDGKCFILPCEYLRVFSPSAEVRGHGVGDQKIIVGKEHVNILSIERIGNYAVKLIFSDGHQSGIYSWKTLYELGVHHKKNWQNYLEKAAWIKKV